MLVRATRAAVVRPEVAEGYGLSQVDLLDYRVLASFMESVGDAVAELSRKLHDVKVPKRLANEYAECVGMLKQMNELATKAFISRRAGRQRMIGAEMGRIAGEVSARLGTLARVPGAEGTSALEVMATLDRVGKLLTDIYDLARITIPYAD